MAEPGALSNLYSPENQCGPMPRVGAIVMKIDFLIRLLWSFGGLALVLPPLREALPRPATIPLIAEPDWVAGGFQPGRTYPTTSAGILSSSVRSVGSWLDGDAWTGEAASRWAPLSSQPVRVAVAGYPRNEGCRLWAEFRGTNGEVSVIPFESSNSGETWIAWDLRPPIGAVSLRIVAEDHSKAHGGWLAFSEPIQKPDSIWPAWIMGLQIFAVLAMAVTLVWLPGLLLAPSFRERAIRAAVLVGTGPLVLTSLGLVIWLAKWWSPTGVATVLVTSWWILLGLRYWKGGRGQNPPPPTASRGTGPRGSIGEPIRTLASGKSILSYDLQCVLCVSVLVVIAAVAKASYSNGPEGELFVGTTSRTLAVGDRSDPGIPFTVAQVAALRLSPYSREAESFFTPWTFFSRGPLAGLAMLPIVLATAGMVPAAFSLSAWQPFDVTGYAASRIVLMVLASTVFIAFHAVLAGFARGRWPVIGAGMLALSPFGVHEVMFTWPKWQATTAVLVAFLLVHDRRPAAGGVALGIGFLFHPLAALWAPFLAVWAGARAEGSVRGYLTQAGRFAVALTLLLGPWMLLGRTEPHLPETVYAGQASFINYFRLAELQNTDWSTWWQTRGMNFTNTFLPFWLHAFHRDHPVLNAHGSQSGELVKFAFGWWNTLPLGMGLGLWSVASLTLLRTIRRHVAAVTLLVIAPGVLLVFYWGGAATGLMRECGHPLIVAVLGVTIFAVSDSSGKLRRSLAHPAAPWLQLPETLLMLWLTTLVTPAVVSASGADLDWVYLGVNFLALFCAAWLLAKARVVPLDST
jgi:hypothetical protein